MIAYLLLAALAAPIQSDTAPPTHRTNAVRLDAETGSVDLDGRLDDRAWQGADTVSGFTQFDPRVGEPSAFRTVARVAVDDNAVYVAVKAYDPEPNKIMAQLTRRDEESPSDMLMVAFDSHHDRRTAYLFGVNPVGVKTDRVFTDDNDQDRGWDANWEVATQRDADGWSAEFRIPLSALRFSAGGDGIWGFEVVRVVGRTGEQSAWAPLNPQEGRIVSRFGELHGMGGLKPPRRLEVTPYALSSVTREPGDPADPFYSATAPSATTGLDVKYGVTSALTLDVTVNPDFGQVESDPSEVNLSAYETFLRERRPFFTEGADIFSFPITVNDNGAEQLFYSRRIGRQPQNGVGAPQRGYLDAPRATTILGAAKLSGKTASGWSVGLLGARTAQERATLADSLGARSHVVVEPATDYAVGRLRKDLNGGRTQIGGVLGAVNRHLDGTGIDWLRTRALSAGVDGSYRFGKEQWMMRGSVLGTHVSGSRRAISLTQRASARFFQRPDADHLQVDSLAESLSGLAGTFQLMRIGGSKLTGGYMAEIRTPGFETNDLGFIREADHHVHVGFLNYQEQKPARPFRRYGFNGSIFNVNDFGWDRTETGINAGGNAQFTNFWRVYGGLNHNLSALSNGSLRGGPGIVKPARYGGWFGGGSDDRKPFSVGLNGGWGAEPESGGDSFRLGVDLEWRPGPATQISVEPFASRNHSAWQYVRQPRDALGVRHYLFADLQQRTAGLGARLDHTFAPTLSFQLYAAPFVSAGKYSDFREVSATPRAERFADRFQPITGGVSPGNPDFNSREMNVNAVLRWEYRLGSTLFLVWSHGREPAEDLSTDGRLRPQRDFGSLFDQPQRNVFLIKANYWLNL